MGPKQRSISFAELVGDSSRTVAHICYKQRCDTERKRIVSDLHRPLTGLQVLDLTDGRGDMCGRMLADLGATVVRVDGVNGGASRQMPPFASDGSSLRYGN